MGGAGIKDLKFNYVKLFVELSHFPLRMLGKIGRTPSILLSMVNTKYGASLVGSEDPVSMAIGLFYGKKIENPRRGTNSNSRKKLFTEEKKSPVVKKQINSNASF